MVLGLTEWSPGGQAPTVYDISRPRLPWDILISDYAHPAASAPLRRIFEIARAHGVVCVVKEPRYIKAGLAQPTRSLLQRRVSSLPVGVPSSAPFHASGQP